MTTGVWSGTVGPNFGHSGTRESLLTQVFQEDQLITILPLRERMWQRCMSHDTAHTPTPRQHHTRELTWKGSSEVGINVGFQYLIFVSVVEGLPMKPVSREVPRVYKCQYGGESKSREYRLRGERAESATVNLVGRIVIKAFRDGRWPGTQREVPQGCLSIRYYSIKNLIWITLIQGDEVRGRLRWIDEWFHQECIQCCWGQDAHLTGGEGKGKKISVKFCVNVPVLHIQIERNIFNTLQCAQM